MCSYLHICSCDRFIIFGGGREALVKRGEVNISGQADTPSEFTIPDISILKKKSWPLDQNHVTEPGVMGEIYYFTKMFLIKF